jgi:hypothetical protein
MHGRRQLCEHCVDAREHHFGLPARPVGLRPVQIQQCAVTPRVAFDRFICRSPRLRCFLPSGIRRAALIAMHSLFIRVRNTSGSSIRWMSPCSRMSRTAFINVRVASRNNTQSVGK